MITIVKSDFIAILILYTFVDPIVLHCAHQAHVRCSHLMNVLLHITSVPVASVRIGFNAEKIANKEVHWRLAGRRNHCTAGFPGGKKRHIFLKQTDHTAELIAY